MALAIADAAMAAPPAAAPAFSHCRLGWRKVWPSMVAGLAAAIPLGLPLLLQPRPLPTPTIARLALSMALLLVLQLLLRWLADTRPLRPAAGALLAFLVATLAGAAAIMGQGAVLLVLIALVLACASRSLADNEPVLAAVAAGVAAACLIELGSLLVDVPRLSWLQPAMGALAAFGMLAHHRAQRHGRDPGQVKLPRGLDRLRDLLLVLMFGTVAASQFALLGDPARVHAVGYAVALLPCPCLLIGLVRCIQLAFTVPGGSARLPFFGDPILVMAALGWIAAASVGFVPVLSH